MLKFSFFYFFTRLYFKNIDFKQKFNKKIDINSSKYYKIISTRINYTSILDKIFFTFL